MPFRDGLVAGPTIGPYATIRELGRGGQAVVYLAEDARLKRPVALKVLVGGGARSERALERFRREAEIGSRLDHPGICAVHDAGDESGVPYIVFRYVRGETLAARIAAWREAPLDRDADPRGIAATFEKIARALHAAHERGVVHRDLKPANIILEPAAESRSERSPLEVPVILDFGLAVSDHDDALVTTTRERGGTPAYMAPERLADAPSADAGVDVYGLGATLYETLTLRPPFEGPTRAVILDAVLRTEPVAPHRVAPAVPPDLSAIVLTAIDRDPARRYATAAAMADDLGRFVTGRPVRARPPGPWLRASRFVRRNVVMSSLVAALFLAITGGLVGSVDANRRLDVATRTVERESERKAAANRARNAAIERFELMSDVVRIDEARAELDTLWPISTERVPALQAWCAGARVALARRSAHERALAELESRLGELGPADEVLDGMSVDAARFLAASIEKHVVDLDAFAGDLAAAERRLQLCRTHAASITTHAREWRHAIAAVDHDSRFAGFRLEPMAGLIPLGVDPESRLPEFLHALSHDAGAPLPVRGGDGRFTVTYRTGMIFVLVPGGTFTMGARRPASGEGPGPNIDPEAFAHEGPIFAVTLAAFMIGKYEITWGQRVRIARLKRPGRVRVLRDRRLESTGADPWMYVMRADTTDLFKLVGFALPTEAQWEYACRAGTTTVFHTGDAAQTLDGYANLRDAACARERTHPELYCEGFDDGHVGVAPVGRFAPNGFGLHDMHGNVWEHCGDRFGAAKLAAERPRDLPEIEAGRSFIVRGGCFVEAADDLRSAKRSIWELHQRSPYLGARPVLVARSQP